MQFSKEIYNSVVYFLKNPELMKKNKLVIMRNFYKIKSKTSSSDVASLY